MKITALFFYICFITAGIVAQNKGVIKGIVKTSDGSPAE